MTTTDKAQFWQAHINAWKTSGLSQTQYCKQQDIRFHNFAYWRTRLNQSKETSTQLLKISGLSTSSRVVLSLPLGIRMDVPVNDLHDVLPLVLRTLRDAL